MVVIQLICSLIMYWWNGRICHVCLSLDLFVWWQDKASEKKSSPDVEVSRRDTSSRNSDVVGHMTEIRPPSSNSLASMLLAETPRTRSTGSAAELQVGPDRATDSVQRTDPQRLVEFRTGSDWSVDSARQNGSIEPSANVASHSMAASCDPIVIPALNTTNDTVPQPTQNLSQREAAKNFVAQWTGDSSQLVAGQSASLNGTASSRNDDGWYYCDPQGQIQGLIILISVAEPRLWTVKLTSIRPPLYRNPIEC